MRTGRASAALLALAFALAPLAVAVVVAHGDGWRPLGDDAAIAVLAHDVTSTRTPLVGMPSTIGARTAAPGSAHHPGPLPFWALAVPERLAGSAPLGLLVGVALVNAAAIATIGIVTFRMAGAGAALAVLVLAVVLAWALGRQTVVAAWNPYLALFPLFALCVLAWAALAGKARALIGVALFAGFVAQAHLLYVPLALVASACAIAGTVYTFARRARGGVPWRRETATVFGATAAVVAATWALPVYEQLAHTPGNFTAIARSIRDSDTTPVGVDYALRVLVQAIALPPLFARQSAGYAVVGESWSQIGVLRIASALLVLTALVVGTALAVRRRDRIAAAAGAIGGVALVTATVVVARVPRELFDVPRYRLLQYWVVGGFVWFATAFVVARALAPRFRWHTRTLQLLGIAAAAVVLAIAPIAIAFADSDGRDDLRLADAIGVLADGIERELPDGEPYAVELQSDRGLVGLQAQYGLYRELDRRGIDARVGADDPYLARSHAAPPHAARLVLTVGRDVPAPADPGARLLGYVVSATTRDVDRVERADEGLRRALRDRSLLTAKGRRALDSTGTDAAILRGLFDGTLDPVALSENGDVARLFLRGLLHGDVFFGAPYRAYNDTHYVVDDLVFGAYLVPGAR